MRTITMALVLLIAMALTYWFFEALLSPDVPDVAIPDSSESIERGRYLVAAGGCVSCHEGTENTQSLSGGRALESEFGTFYVSNITPDVATGIGGWRGKDFLLALKHGRNPDGGYYYPAFPYLAYSGLSDQDVLDIAAYLMSLPAVEFTIPSHEVPAWLQRWTLAGWNELAAISMRVLSVEPEFARGAYLIRNLGHCGECHTPRNLLGIPDFSREFSGAPLGDDEVEAIDTEALAQWTQEDLVYFFFLGVKPDGEFVGGEMEKVIEHNTSKLTLEDREAMAAFLKRH